MKKPQGFSPPCVFDFAAKSAEMSTGDKKDASQNAGGASGKRKDPEHISALGPAWWDVG